MISFTRAVLIEARAPSFETSTAMVGLADLVVRGVTLLTRLARGIVDLAVDARDVVL
jgi:hypothetical protein